MASAYQRPVIRHYNYSHDQQRAILEATPLTNAAVAKFKQGQFKESLELHRRSLAIKLQAFGEESVQAALSYNGIGEQLLRLGELDEAEQVLLKAVHIRDRLNQGFDTACTRENLAQVYEAQGRLQDARAIRKSDMRDKQIACANYECPIPESLKKDKFKQCSGCHCVFYCSRACQTIDWKKRHKKYCLKKTDEGNKGEKEGDEAANGESQ